MATKKELEAQIEIQRKRAEIALDRTIQCFDCVSACKLALTLLEKTEDEYKKNGRPYIYGRTSMSYARIKEAVDKSGYK